MATQYTEVGKSLTHTSKNDDKMAMKYAIRPFLISNAIVVALMVVCFAVAFQI